MLPSSPRVARCGRNRRATARARSRSRRAARDWQFLDAVGPHAGLLGREDGIVRSVDLSAQAVSRFPAQVPSRRHRLDGDAIPRTITVRPESSSVKYIYDSFTACATWFVPIDQRAAIVEIEVNSAEPVAVEASFTPDVAWMWPAAVGDAYSQWDAQLKAFRFSNDHHVFWAIAGVERRERACSRLTARTTLRATPTSFRSDRPPRATTSIAL